MASFRLLRNNGSHLLRTAGFGLSISFLNEKECSKSTSNVRNIEDVYDLLDNRPIGMGGFGVVCPGRHRVTGETVAIKSVSKTKITEKNMLKEAEIMRLCGDHHYVADFVDLFESDTHWYLIMEMASGGELFDRLITRGPYTEAHASVLIREVAEALAYIHQQGVVHFDLKPENILIHSKRPDGSRGEDPPHGEETTRITDFGSAFQLTEPIERRIPSTGSGTSAYMPPEALVDEGERGPCDTSADIWSLGIVMYIILAGAHPFDLENNATDREVEDRILNNDVVMEGGDWDKVSIQGKDLLRKLLSKNPSERPTATQVLEHSWMFGSANKIPLEDFGENLRRFHRGRRRLKALLLATMLGLGKHTNHTTECSSSSLSTKKSENQESSSSNQNQDQEEEEALGSRLAALKLFDLEGKGCISADDLARVVKSVGDDLSETEILEMLRAADQNPRTTQKVIIPEQMLKLVPPLSPPKSYDYLGTIFQSGQRDPQAYLVTEGEVILSFMPKHGGTPIQARSVGRGEIIGDSELLSADGTVLPRLHSAQCISSDGCKLLAIGKDLFSHLTDVFETLGEDLSIRANNHLHATLAQWLQKAESTTSLHAAPGVTFYPVPTENSSLAISNEKKSVPRFFSWPNIGWGKKDRVLEGEGSIGWGELLQSVETSGCLVIIEEGECEVELECTHSDSWSVTSRTRPSPMMAVIKEEVTETSSKKKVGPGFICYCGPSRHSPNEKQVPPSLRSLPRCVKMKASEASEDGEKSVVVATAVAGQELHELLKQPGMSVLRGYVNDLANSDPTITTDSCQSVAISKCRHRHIK